MTGNQANSRQITDFFRDIAEQHGSHAIWLPQSGLLVMDDDQEAARSYPDEAWRDQSLQ